MTVSNARNDFIKHLVPMSTEAEDCGLRVDICLRCSGAAEAINTLLKTLAEELEPNCSQTSATNKLLSPWSVVHDQIRKDESKKAPGCNGQGQAAAAVGDGEDRSLLFPATSHFSTFLFPTQLFRAYFRGSTCLPRKWDLICSPHPPCTPLHLDLLRTSCFMLVS